MNHSAVGIAASLFFAVWATYAIFNEKITVKGETYFKDATPLSFWSTIVMFYGCSITFTLFIYNNPLAVFCTPFMVVLAVFNIICILLKK